MSEATAAEVYIYDLEIYPNLFSCVMKSRRTGEVKTVCVHADADNIDETHMEFWELVHFFDNPNRWFSGYNSFHFDDQIIVWLLRNYRTLVKMDLVDLTQSIWAFTEDLIAKEGRSEYKYHKHFRSLDLKKIGRLFKGLKQVGTNLKWGRIQDLPIKVGTYITADQIDDLLDYNLNDVLLTEQLYEELQEEIQLRYAISHAYGVDVMNEDRSGVANRMLEAFYSRETGMSRRVFKEFRTQRHSIPLKDTISDKIKFKTPKLQAFLEEVKSQTVSPSDKFRRAILINGTIYDIAKGGIHSRHKNESKIYESSDDVIIMDADVGSFYPKVMEVHRIKPAHLDDAMLNILVRMTGDRLEAKDKAKRLKAKGDPEWEIWQVKADALKIVINSIFGKMGDIKYWLYDPKAMYEVTLNGQFYLLMLIEKLEENGINVFYANTDGITAEVQKDQMPTYEAICKAWEKYTGFSLEYARYKKFILRDVNNYIVELDETNEDGSSKVKMKGVFNTKRYKELAKAFHMPVVPLAIRNFFIDGTPVEETICNHPDPIDFCLAPQSDNSFQIELDRHGENGIVTEKLQKTNRFLVSNRVGGALYKCRYGKRDSVPPVGGEMVQLANDHHDGDQYDIKYDWYIRQAKKEIVPFFASQTSLF